MSPNEIDQIKARLFPALEKLGWTRCEHKVQHERDWGSKWKEVWWRDRDGNYLLMEEDLTEGLAAELIRLAELLQMRK